MVAVGGSCWAMPRGKCVPRCLQLTVKLLSLTLPLHNVVTATCCCSYFVATAAVAIAAAGFAAEKCMSLPEGGSHQLRWPR